jgi:hypothetical protein
MEEINTGQGHAGKKALGQCHVKIGHSNVTKGKKG